MLYVAKKRDMVMEVSDTGGWIVYLQCFGGHYMAPFEFDPDSQKMRGGSFLCLPYSGNYFNLQHGNFRIKDYCLLKKSYTESGKKAYGIACSDFILEPQKRDAYRWYVEGNVDYIHSGNKLIVRVDLQGNKKAPVNPCWHPFWKNPNGIVVTMGDFQKVIIEAIPLAERIPYTGPVTLDIKGIGKVVMSITSNCDQANPQVVFWGDRRDRTCVELTLDDPKKISTPEGIYLGKELIVSFVNEFFPARK